MWELRMAQHPSLKGNPRRTQVTYWQYPMTVHNAVLCSLRNVMFTNDIAQTRWMEGYAASQKDTDPALVKMQGLKCVSSIAKPPKYTESLPTFSPSTQFLLALFGEAQHRFWLLSTQEYKLNIHFSHFLSNFAFPGPRYDFIFKVKFFRSLAHND